MKAFAVALASASALSLLALLLLVRATRQLVPGKGPQGGEAIVLFWVLLLGWAWVAAVAALVATGLVTSELPLVRFVLFPAGAVAGSTAWVALAFITLARGLEPSSTPSQAGQSALLAGLLAALLLAGSPAILLRVVFSRP